MPANIFWIYSFSGNSDLVHLTYFLRFKYYVYLLKKTNEYLMAIHPIEYRYGNPEMKAVWTEETRLAKMLSVESALAKAEALVGYIPKGTGEKIAAGVGKVTLVRVKEIEDEIHHDVMAVVLALSEQSDDAAKWEHLCHRSREIMGMVTSVNQ